jgi:iron complex transport system ATP-binding protein
MSAVIQVENLCFGFAGHPCLLDTVSFQVESGDFLGIAGPNGVGKTTLLKLLSGQLRPTSGTVSVQGRPVHALSVSQRAQQMAVVRQQAVPVFGYTVAQTVMMARTQYLSASGFESSHDRSILSDVLASTDTTHLADRALWSLSGGERQRVFIARALAQRTDLLLLDEPTSFLDLKHQIATYDLLKVAQMHQQRTIVAITHDINLAAQYCNRILLLGNATEESCESNKSRKKNYFMGPPDEVLTEERITRVFGIAIASGVIGNVRLFVPLSRAGASGKMF